ncbi:MAG: class I SAM-dependent methyltransferase [Ginsengibacter sp.]
MGKKSWKIINHIRMYSSFQLAKKFIQYYFKSGNGKGHGIHSPFVFDFVKNILNDNKHYDSYKSIERLRKHLLNDNTIITVEDFGAGSAVIPYRDRKVSAIAASSLKKKKFGQLLFRIAKYYKPKTIVELGTSFGITTSYLACANSSSRVFTIEGSKSIGNIAQANFKKLNLENINFIQGNFETAFPKILGNIEIIDLLFVDGNHRLGATLNYFQESIKKSGPASIFIFDDIHWSSEMEDAWEQIKTHSSVTLTIDLFFIGLVFFNPDFKVKQDFVIRF